jgi:hypothetical protein
MEKTENTNCLEGMQCPKCGSLEPFRLAVMQNVTMFDEGSTETTGDIEFDEKTFCMCMECDHEGTVGDFYIEKESVAALSIVAPHAIPNRELSTILAALRYWQEEVVKDQTFGEYFDFFAEHSPLTAEEIDTLCEQLNFGENINIPPAELKEEYTPAEPETHCPCGDLDCTVCGGNPDWKKGDPYKPTNYFNKDGKVDKIL